MSGMQLACIILSLGVSIALVVLAVGAVRQARSNGDDA